MRTCSTILFLLFSFVAIGQAFAQVEYVAELTGGGVVPPTPSAAQGHFQLIGDCDENSPGSSSMFFTLQQRNVVGSTGAYIAQGDPGQNGSMLYTLSSSGFYLISDLFEVSAEHCQLLGDGMLYVVITSSAYPEGELRGRIEAALPVLDTSWGRIRKLFRN